MKSVLPAYRWVCQKCEAVNEAGTDVCAACAFPARSTALELARAKDDDAPANAWIRNAVKVALYAVVLIVYVAWRWSRNRA